MGGDRERDRHQGRLTLEAEDDRNVAKAASIKIE